MAFEFVIGFMFVIGGIYIKQKKVFNSSSDARKYDVEKLNNTISLNLIVLGLIKVLFFFISIINPNLKEVLNTLYTISLIILVFILAISLNRCKKDQNR